MSTSSSLAILAKAARSSLDSPHSVCISVKLRILPGGMSRSALMTTDSPAARSNVLTRAGAVSTSRVLSSPMARLVATSATTSPVVPPQKA